MPSTDALWAFVPAALLVIASPGPAMLLVLGALARSRRHALVAVLGLAVGDLLLISLAGLGLAGLVLRWPVLLLALRWLGAAYVAWMGLRSLWASLRPPQPQAAAGTPPASPHAGFRAALLLTLFNPKLVLFFAAFLPLFLDPRQAHWLLGFFGLGALFELLNLAWYALLIGALGSVAARHLDKPWLQRTSAVALLGCAALVLWA